MQKPRGFSRRPTSGKLAELSRLAKVRHSMADAPTLEES
jgi:hypothetical protein